MTAALVSIALVLSAPPVDSHPTSVEEPWTPIAFSAAPSPEIWFPEETTSWGVSGFAEIVPPVSTVPAAVPETPTTTPSKTVRERTLSKLAELGAPEWVVAAFDCVGWYESKWANVRSRTGDTGVLQINDVHRPELARLGLDPWVPEDSAEFAWRLFTRAGWSFRDWNVRGLCGLR